MFPEAGQGRKEKMTSIRLSPVSRILILLTGDCKDRGGLQVVHKGILILFPCGCG